jgi:hypothetical protein
VRIAPPAVAHIAPMMPTRIFSVAR